MSRYNGEGQIVSETDALGNQTINTYNQLDELIKIQEPNASVGPGTASSTKIVRCP